jgi:DNA-binding response OmpR family regulator
MSDEMDKRLGRGAPRHIPEEQRVQPDDAARSCGLVHQKILALTEDVAEAIVIDVEEGGIGLAELRARLHACIGIKPTIVLGNSSEESNKAIAFQAGAPDYLAKPFAAPHRDGERVIGLR